MNRQRIVAIARWEYLQKVRSKGFILTLFLTPLIVIISSVAPAYLADQPRDATTTIGIVDYTGTLFQSLKQNIESSEKLANGSPAYALADYSHRTPTFDSSVAEADRDALKENVEGTITIRDSAGEPVVTYRSPNPNNIRMTESISRSIRRIITDRRLSEAGIDTALYNRLSREVTIHPIKISRNGEASSNFLQTFFTAYAGCFLLMFLVMTTGQSLVRSLVEEKSNRIMELLVSSCTPRELMWGKLLGLSGLGLTQMVIWGIVGVGVATTSSILGGLNTSLAAIYGILPLIFLYIALGYMFFAAIFIGVGSLVTNEQEAQAATSILVMALVIPVISAIGIVQNPDASYARVLSYVPFFTPSMMMIRMVTKMPSAVEIISTIAVMIFSTIAMVWCAARVFSTAILLYGKRPSVGEIVRWIREER